MSNLPDNKNYENQIENEDKYELPKFFSGPLMFFLIVFILPIGSFSFAAKGAIATIIWMALWWIFRPVHIGITGLLPIIVTSLFNFVPVEEILSSYASPIIILLLGANMITVSWERWGLDKRIALRALCFIGGDIKQQLVVWFTMSIVLTIFLPNTVVAAVLAPIAVSMFKYFGLENNINKSKIATAILLSIAWGTGLGGFGSPLGGAMNLITIEYIENQVIGREYMFLTWTTRMLPMLILVSGAILLYLLSFDFETEELSGSKKFFIEKYNKMDAISKGEKWSLILFICPVLLSFGRPIFNNLLPSLTPSYIFLLFGILTFIVPGNDEKKLSTWEYTGPKLMWGLFFLFGGGIAIGRFISISGAGENIAKILIGTDIKGGIFIIALIVLMGIILSNISSNTAAVAILVPIVGSIMSSAEINPIPYIYIASIASNCAYILPTSVRAIPVGYGLDPKILFSKGFLAILISFFVVTIFGYLFTLYWPGFSVAL